MAEDTPANPKTCESCGQTFDCQPENIEACQCNAVQLSTKAREVISQQYGDCLCAACLRKFAAMHNQKSR